MNSVVADASVAAKWFPCLDQESLGPEARALLS